MRITRYPMVKSENDRIWQKYCGFFDLTTEQFRAIQETLLAQQLERVAGSHLANKLMGANAPRTVDEFRHVVPLTSYRDYAQEFRSGNEAVLPEKPYTWALTSGASGDFKRIPFTREFYDHELDHLMATFILSCSEKRGQSRLIEGDKVLFNVAPHPYLSGILASGACQTFNLKTVMPADEHDSMDFKEKVAKGFEEALKTGADILVAMTSVLVKLGHEFGELSRDKDKPRRATHPMVLYRYGRALLRSRLEGRGILPRDLWPLKAIIGWGIDTRIYREQVKHYWGIYPYELHACTEAGIMALQNWNRKDLTLLPHSNFFEFIPEREWSPARDDMFAEPATVLIDEVRPDQRYELVITGFYGMPFIRYRLGHLVRVTALEDREAGVSLPQFVFEARTDDLIDIAGFTRISEKTVAQAIADTGVRFDDWSIRKEVNYDRTALHLYIEPRGGHSLEELAPMLHRALAKLDPGYRDLETMMGIRPLQVTTLRPGTFAEYYDRQRERGANLLERKPSRMNASDEAIRELVQIGTAREVLVA